MKTKSNSTLQRLTKAELIEELRITEMNLESIEALYHQQIENVKDWEPVKHGQWTIDDIVTYESSYGGTLYEPVYRCSCCGRVTESYVRGDEPIMPEDADFPNYCPHCGARMEAEDES